MTGPAPRRCSRRCNSINRHEVVRAYSHLGGSTEVPDFNTFAPGHDGTDTVELRIGGAGSTAAAGSL